MSTPQMPFPHHHTGPTDDIVTFHAERSVTSVQRHLMNEHGVDAIAMPPAQVFQRHAEIHAVLMSAEQAAQLTDRDKRTYAAALLRRMCAEEALEELEPAYLPLSTGSDDTVSIVSLDVLREWLFGLAIRIENGEDL